MKIFNKNLTQNTRTINLKPNFDKIHHTKYFPAFAKEWKNIIYSFNKNNMKNIAANSVNINKIIKSYFNLFFKKKRFLGRTKFVYLKKRRNFLRRIFVSDANIKYTNSKAKITLYTINKQKKVLQRKFSKLNKKITLRLFKKYAFLHNNIIKNINSSLNKKYNFDHEVFFVPAWISPKNFVRHSIKNLFTLVKLYNLCSQKMWMWLLEKRTRKYFILLRKYNLLYSLNQFKFNKSKLLSKLTYLLEKILGRKIEYNIVNLKSISHHPDLLTDILALKVKKDRYQPGRRMNSIINKAPIAKINKRDERRKPEALQNIDIFKTTFRDLKIISHINKKRNLRKKVLSTKLRQKAIHKSIFNSIGYKNLRGIKLKVSGRLTKRNRADRSIQILKGKGSLKNVDSSFKQLTTISFRGNANSNVSYSFSKSKRRIGSFAVKGWIGGGN